MALDLSLDLRPFPPNFNFLPVSNLHLSRSDNGEVTSLMLVSEILPLTLRLRFEESWSVKDGPRAEWTWLLQSWKAKYMSLGTKVNRVKVGEQTVGV